MKRDNVNLDEDILIEEFLNIIEGISQSIDKRTKYQYRTIIYGFWKKEFPNRPLLSLSFIDLTKTLNKMRKEEYKTNTIINYFMILSSFYTQCHKRKLIETNPVSDVRFPKIEERSATYMTSNELKSLLSQILSNVNEGNESYETLFLVYVPSSLGTRISETSKLNLTSFNYERKIVSVIGKGNKERAIALSDDPFFKDLLPFFLEERKQRLIRRYEDEWVNEQAFFINTRGGRRSVRDIERIIKGLGKRYKFMADGNENEITPHKFRHSYCSHLISQGIDPYAVSILAGHQDLRTTLGYVHTRMNQIQDQFDKKKPIHFTFHKNNEVQNNA